MLIFVMLVKEAVVLRAGLALSCERIILLLLSVIQVITKKIRSS